VSQATVELPVSASGKAAEDVAREAARTASDVILPRFLEINRGNPIDKTAKGRGNFVTETDLACEEAVLDILRREFPEHKLLSEETADTAEVWDEGWLWVIDPLDGTGNFARGIPTFVFNIALCHDGAPVLGLTVQPVTGDEFFAVRGGGLQVNGAPAQVSKASRMADSLMGMGLGYDYDRAAKLLSLLSDLWPGVQMIQNIGSAALGLAYAASGRFDLYVHQYVFPWDIAAGVLFIEEGGGLIIDREGAPVTIYSEGLIAGAPGAVRDFAEYSAGKPWR
jgi:myo-inositol-1(or 4)-monophosphatase